jgi:hypothetical protein
MKLDLDIYGVSYFGDLDDEDAAFLAGVDIDPRRWARPPRHRQLVDRARRIVLPAQPLPGESGRASSSAGGSPRATRQAP